MTLLSDDRHKANALQVLAELAKAGFRFEIAEDGTLHVHMPGNPSREQMLNVEGAVLCYRREIIALLEAEAEGRS